MDELNAKLEGMLKECNDDQQTETDLKFSGNQCATNQTVDHSLSMLKEAPAVNFSGRKAPAQRRSKGTGKGKNNQGKGKTKNKNRKNANPKRYKNPSIVLNHPTIELKSYGNAFTKGEVAMMSSRNNTKKVKLVRCVDPLQDTPATDLVGKFVEIKMLNKNGTEMVAIFCITAAIAQRKVKEYSREYQYTPEPTEWFAFYINAPRHEYFRESSDADAAEFIYNATRGKIWNGHNYEGITFKYHDVSDVPQLMPNDEPNEDYTHFVAYNLFSKVYKYGTRLRKDKEGRDVPNVRYLVKTNEQLETSKKVASPNVGIFFTVFDGIPKQVTTQDWGRMVTIQDKEDEDKKRKLEEKKRNAVHQQEAKLLHNANQNWLKSKIDTLNKLQSECLVEADTATKQQLLQKFSLLYEQEKESLHAETITRTKLLQMGASPKLVEYIEHMKAQEGEVSEGPKTPPTNPRKRELANPSPLGRPR